MSKSSVNVSVLDVYVIELNGMLEKVTLTLNIAVSLYSNGLEYNACLGQLSVSRS